MELKTKDDVDKLSGINLKNGKMIEEISRCKTIDEVKELIVKWFKEGVLSEEDKGTLKWIGKAG